LDPITELSRDIEFWSLRPAILSSFRWWICMWLSEVRWVNSLTIAASACFQSFCQPMSVHAF
jgi:hypothetical protein